MSFRRRITIVSAAAVAIAVVLASILTYVLTSDQLRSQVDTQLSHRAREASGLERVLLGGRAHPHLFGRLPPSPVQVRGYQQMVSSSGSILAQSVPGVSLPVDTRTRELAARGGRAFFSDTHVDGIHLRVLAEPFGSGRAVQLALPLTEVDSLLGRLRLILVLLVVGGIALAALLGRLVAGAAVQPLKRLTQATEHIALTRDLSGRVERSGEDELGRLATSFNAMLDALERSMSALDASVHAQRQLVADASHELRTPVTSLRTNIEILQQQGQDMDPQDNRRLLGDVVEQIEELTLLMNDLIDLARGEEPRADTEELRLDLLVSEVVERARRHAPATPLRVKLEPTIVTGVPARPRAGGRQPDRQRRQVQPVRRARRGPIAGRGAVGARPRAGNLGRGPAAHLRPLLSRRRRARPTRLRAGPGDRATGGGSAGRQRQGRAGPRGRNAHAPASARRRGARAGGPRA